MLVWSILQSLRPLVWFVHLVRNVVPCPRSVRLGLIFVRYVSVVVANSSLFIVRLVIVPLVVEVVALVVVVTLVGVVVALIL